MLNFEIKKPYLKEESKEGLLDTTNEMQGKLALRYFNFDSKDAITKWIDEYSSRFRSIIDAHPEYVKEYESDPEGVLDQIEKEIYKGEKAEKIGG